MRFVSSLLWQLYRWSVRHQPAPPAYEYEVTGTWKHQGAVETTTGAAGLGRVTYG